MALERLQARAAAGVPDLDGPVVGRLRQPGRVVREGHRVDPIAMALERLQARTPFVVHDRSNYDFFELFVMKQTSNDTTCWTENQCRCICLERVILNCPLMIHDESLCVLNKLNKFVLVLYFLCVLAYTLSTLYTHEGYEYYTCNINHSFVIKTTPCPKLVHRLSPSS